MVVRRRGRPKTGHQVRKISTSLPKDLYEFTNRFKNRAHFISDCIELASPLLLKKYFPKDPKHKIPKSRTHPMIFIASSVSLKAYERIRKVPEGYRSEFIRACIRQAPAEIIDRHEMFS